MTRYNKNFVVLEIQSYVILVIDFSILEKILINFFVFTDSVRACFPAITDQLFQSAVMDWFHIGN